MNSLTQTYRYFPLAVFLGLCITAPNPHSTCNRTVDHFLRISLPSKSISQALNQSKNMHPGPNSRPLIPFTRTELDGAEGAIYSCLIVPIVRPSTGPHRQPGAGCEVGMPIRSIKTYLNASGAQNGSFSRAESLWTIRSFEYEQLTEAVMVTIPSLPQTLPSVFYPLSWVCHCWNYNSEPSIFFQTVKFLASTSCCKVKEICRAIYYILSNVPHFHNEYPAGSTLILSICDLTVAKKCSSIFSSLP